MRGGGAGRDPDADRPGDAAGSASGAAAWGRILPADRHRRSALQVADSVAQGQAVASGPPSGVASRRSVGGAGGLARAAGQAGDDGRRLCWCGFQRRRE